MENIEDNHFAKNCFNQRFSQEESLYNLVELKRFDILALHAYQYITDLLINLASKPNPSSLQPMLIPNNPIPVVNSSSFNKSHQRAQYRKSIDLEKTSLPAQHERLTTVTDEFDPDMPHYSINNESMSGSNNKYQNNIGQLKFENFRMNRPDNSMENNISFNSYKSSKNLVDISKYKTINQLNEYFGNNLLLSNGLSLFFSKSIFGKSKKRDM